MTLNEFKTEHYQRKLNIIKKKHRIFKKKGHFKTLSLFSKLILLEN